MRLQVLNDGNAPIRPKRWQYAVQGVLALLTIVIFSACATDSRPTVATNYPMNLDEATRVSHNPLLPPSIYESNHELDD